MGFIRLEDDAEFVARGDTVQYHYSVFDLAGLHLLTCSMSFSLKTIVESTDNGVYLNTHISIDGGVSWLYVYNQWSSNIVERTWTFNIPDVYGNLDSVIVRQTTGASATHEGNEIMLYDTALEVTTLAEELTGLDNAKTLTMSVPYTSFSLVNDLVELVFEHITNPVVGDGDGGDGGEEEVHTSTNIISGNVTKLGLPFAANVVCVSVDNEPTVVGQGVSDAVTGDYSVDVYPHTKEVMVYVAPQYGKEYSNGLYVVKGDIIHPETPNGRVYIVENTGVMGDNEPVWNDVGQIITGEVVLTSTLLYRPLMNGYVKPLITQVVE